MKGRSIKSISEITLKDVVYLLSFEQHGDMPVIGQPTQLHPLRHSQPIPRTGETFLTKNNNNWE